MCDMISCLVDRQAKVYAVDGIHSHARIAKHFGITEDFCLKYEFHLANRFLFQDFGIDRTPFTVMVSHNEAAQKFFDQCAGTPKKLMAYVQRGNWDAQILYSLLTDDALVKFENDKMFRRAYNARTKAEEALEKTRQRKYKLAKTKKKEALAMAEEMLESAKKNTDERSTAMKTYCKAHNLAIDAFNRADNVADKVYGEALAIVDAKLDKVYTKMWIKLFSNSKNRIAIWKK